MRYLTNKRNCQLRTHESHLQDVNRMQLMNSKEKSRGVKGPSALTELKYFHMVWGFPYDIGHTTYLGICESEFKIWSYLFFSNKNKRLLRLLDERLTQIRPIRELHRRPLSIQNLSLYKIKDWKN